MSLVLHENVDERPAPLAVTDLTAHGEVFDSSGNLTHTYCAYVDDQDRAWFGTVGRSKFDLTPQILSEILQRVPDDRVYPPLISPLTVFRDVLDSKHVYIKRPTFPDLDHEQVAPLIPIILAEEAEILEILKSRPHSNLVEYYGCLVRRERIVGIALRRSPATLLHRYRDDPRPLDMDVCIRGIQAGLDHLHALGYAHNDINPANIVLEDTDNPVIIDFGSCKKFGVELKTAGTPGFVDDEDEEWCLSAQHHDATAMDKMKTWLQVQHNDRIHSRNPEPRV